MLRSWPKKALQEEEFSKIVPLVKTRATPVFFILPQEDTMLATLVAI